MCVLIHERKRRHASGHEPASLIALDNSGEVARRPGRRLEPQQQFPSVRMGDVHIDHCRFHSNVRRNEDCHMHSLKGVIWNGDRKKGSGYGVLHLDAEETPRLCRLQRCVGVDHAEPVIRMRPHERRVAGPPIVGGVHLVRGVGKNGVHVPPRQVGAAVQEENHHPRHDRSRSGRASEGGRDVSIRVPCLTSGVCGHDATKAAVGRGTHQNARTRFAVGGEPPVVPHRTHRQCVPVRRVGIVVGVVAGPAVPRSEEDDGPFAPPPLRTRAVQCGGVMRPHVVRSQVVGRSPAVRVHVRARQVMLYAVRLRVVKDVRARSGQQGSGGQVDARGDAAPSPQIVSDGGNHACDGRAVIHVDRHRRLGHAVPRGIPRHVLGHVQVGVGEVNTVVHHNQGDSGQARSAGSPRFHHVGPDKVPLKGEVGVVTRRGRGGRGRGGNTPIEVVSPWEDRRRRGRLAC